MASAYSPEQIDRFLALIQLPPRFHPSHDPPRDILLTTLHTHCISTIPYENLSLHYSPRKRVFLDPADLYRKIVLDGRGCGGYCMEASLFFLHMLRGLGFDAYPVGVRIRLRADGVPAGPYVGWVHIVSIVTLGDGGRWVVDVGFGGDGATRPLPLSEGHVTRNLGTQDIRLIRDYIPEQTQRGDEERKLWIYEYRNGPERDWNSCYALHPGLGFMPADFDVMCGKTFTPLVTLFLRRPNTDLPGDEEIYGKRMLVNGSIKENLGGRTVVLQECQSEDERVAALRKWFSITLTDEERVGIEGHVAELKA
ncbi:hypothetical protein LTR53_009988 [Teratosphaeriaceae sp. CCFEE 6253]|nr:hypothetical protein LTR53_009988 [Teratosphaeriaceae sp. CCFEE 6253]